MIHDRMPRDTIESQDKVKVTETPSCNNGRFYSLSRLPLACI